MPYISPAGIPIKIHEDYQDLRNSVKKTYAHHSDRKKYLIAPGSFTNSGDYISEDGEFISSFKNPINLTEKQKLELMRNDDIFLAKIDPNDWNLNKFIKDYSKNWNQYTDSTMNEISKLNNQRLTYLEIDEWLHNTLHLIRQNKSLDSFISKNEEGFINIKDVFKNHLINSFLKESLENVFKLSLNICINNDFRSNLKLINSKISPIDEINSNDLELKLTSLKLRNEFNYFNFNKHQLEFLRILNKLKINSNVYNDQMSKKTFFNSIISEKDFGISSVFQLNDSKTPLNVCINNILSEIKVHSKPKLFLKIKGQAKSNSICKVKHTRKQEPIHINMNDGNAKCPFHKNNHKVRDCPALKAIFLDKN